MLGSKLDVCWLLPQVPLGRDTRAGALASPGRHHPPDHIRRWVYRLCHPSGSGEGSGSFHRRCWWDPVVGALRRSSWGDVRLRL